MKYKLFFLFILIIVLGFITIETAFCDPYDAGNYIMGCYKKQCDNINTLSLTYESLRPFPGQTITEKKKLKNRSQNEMYLNKKPFRVYIKETIFVYGLVPVALAEFSDGKYEWLFQKGIEKPSKIPLPDRPVCHIIPYFFQLKNDYKYKLIKIELLNPFKGKFRYTVEVVRPIKPNVTLWLEGAALLLIKSKYKDPESPGQSIYHYYSDYREVAGVLFAFEINMYRDNNIINNTIINEIKINSVTNFDIFDPEKFRF